jgi:Protein of unknown function (DUF2961)
MFSDLSFVGTSKWGRSRSVSAENPRGMAGQGGRATDGSGAPAARKLGLGWKVSPNVTVPAATTRELAAVTGPGIIRHIWITSNRSFRQSVLRFYWDGASGAAIECPLGDFFCSAWSRHTPITSLPVVGIPYCGLNCYWEMPFKRDFRVTIENIGIEDAVITYQIDYSHVDVPDEVGYLHARWHRESPVNESSVYTILDCQRGPGLYVGTYLAVGVNHPGWWGEGEFKFFIDDDDEFPTICGTGLEDYFCGAYDFNVPGAGYTTTSAPFVGLNQVLKPDGLYVSQQRFSLYRWHLVDPIAFDQRLKVTVQDLGWQEDGTYMKRRDDIASVAYWYDAEPEGIESGPMTIERLDVGEATVRRAYQAALANSPRELLGRRDR